MRILKQKTGKQKNRFQPIQTVSLIRNHIKMLKIIFLQVLASQVGSGLKWTVLGQSGRFKRLKLDGLRKWTVPKYQFWTDRPLQGWSIFTLWTVHFGSDSSSEKDKLLDFTSRVNFLFGFKFDNDFGEMIRK